MHGVDWINPSRTFTYTIYVWCIHGCNKVHDKSFLKEGFILAHRLREHSSPLCGMHGSKSMKQMTTMCVHFESTEWWDLVDIFLSDFCAIRTITHVTVSVTFRMGVLYLGYQDPQASLQTCTEVCLLSACKSYFTSHNALFNHSNVSLRCISLCNFIVKGTGTDTWRN